MLAALEDGFYAFNLGSGRFNPNVLPEYGNPYVRFNDGNADRQGRFLSGTMQLGEAIEAPGKLYRLEPDGSTLVFERGLAVSNSLCFSPSGDALYLADSI